MPRVVTAFNDRSGRLLPSGKLDFEANSANTSVTYRKGAGLIGWATSADGKTWAYHGKLQPPTGWAVLIADPAAAVDPQNKATVYVGMLAQSNSSWNTSFGASTTEISTPLRPSATGFCVARSTDAGLTFPAVQCVEAGTEVDLSALTVDGTGRVWFATVDKLNVGTKIWRSTSAAAWGSFQLVIPTCDDVGDPDCSNPSLPQNFVAGDEPRLVTDLFGEVWLSTVRTGTIPARLEVVSWDNATDFTNGYFRLSDECGLLNLLTAGSINAVIGSGAAVIRNAFRYSLAFGLTNVLRNHALRVAYEFELPGLGRHIQVAELSSEIPAQTCAQIPGWSTTGAPTALVSNNFMTALNYQNRGSGAGGVNNPEWWLAYATDVASESRTDKYLNYRAAALNLLPTPVVFPQVQMAPSNYYTCPGGAGYWGDYIGLTQFNPTPGLTTGWQNVSTFSDSRPAPPCGPAGILARPVQVASFRWSASQ
ncbi:MAG: hypothetical protein R3B13_33760 [Polyangiaceae bacterium]